MSSHQLRLQNIYHSCFDSIEDDFPLYFIYKQAGIAYEQIRDLNKEYGFIEDDEFDHTSIYYMAEWIKNNAAWWAEGQIDDKTFVQGLQYLIQKSILRV